MAFNLQSIQRTKRMRAPKVVIAGPGKIGKTTFAAMAPNAIGILTEDGADAVDASAFPLCQSLDDVYSAIATLYNEDHQFETVFIDSLDWLEPLLHAYVCKANKWDHIEAPGYGKGYVAALDVWREFLDGINALRDDRGMAAILIAHADIKRFDSPETDPYDRYQPKLHSRAAAPPRCEPVNICDEMRSISTPSCV